MQVRGKKVYKTSMLFFFRCLLLALLVFFYHDLYLGTFLQDGFIKAGDFDLLSVVKFHWKYPVEFITLSIIILPSFLYYGFIRGVCFYEKGFLFNKGLPFLNTWVEYSECENYKILAPKSMIAVQTKTGDLYLVGDSNIERIIAILDQHDVQGDLAQDAFVKLVKNAKRFFYGVSLFTILLYVAIKLGLFRFIA
jgi:hypothetical protein